MVPLTEQQSATGWTETTDWAKEAITQNNCHSENPFNCLVKNLFQTESNMEHQLQTSLSCWRRFSIKFVPLRQRLITSHIAHLFYFGDFVFSHTHINLASNFHGALLFVLLGFSKLYSNCVLARVRNVRKLRLAKTVGENTQQTS